MNGSIANILTVAVFAALVSVIGATEDGKTDLIFHEVGAKGSNAGRPMNDPKTPFHIVLPDGTSVKTFEAPGCVRTARATPQGTALLCAAEGVVEVGRDGEPVWTMPYPADWKKHAVLKTAELLPNGHLFLARMATQGKPQVIFVEFDKEKGILRKTPPYPGAILSARPVGNERILIASFTGVTEIDWEGKTCSTLPLEPGYFCADAVRLANGNTLVALKVSGGIVAKPSEKGKSAMVAEVDPQGKILWSVKPSCPLTLQPLPDGHVLIGSG